VPKTAALVGAQLCLLFLAGCSAWLPETEAVPPEPEVVVTDTPPVVEPEPEATPEAEPTVQVPTPPVAPPIAIVLTSSQPAYLDVASELAGYFENHTVYDLSNESLPPVAVLRSINDSEASAVVAVGLRAAQSAVSLAERPVVFSQVFNYQQHDLLGENSRGVAAIAPMEAQLSAWKQVSPDLRRIGIIIGEGHDELLQSAQRAADKHAVELDIRIAHSDQETLFLFRRMLAEIDGFWLLPDNRVLSTRVLTEMLEDARRYNVAVAVPSDSMLQIGAGVAISTVAADIAKSIAAVLRRIHAGDMKQVPPITELSEVRVTVND
jgi:ABC-type uncharacterized transport system substrate-binding protein